MKKLLNRSGAVPAGEVADGDVRAQIGVIGEDIRNLGKQVRHLAGQQLHSIGDRANAFAEGVGERVRERPMRAVLIAAGVGALAGLLFWRR